MSRLDLLTRTWWRAVGRPVDVRGEHAWLDAPTSETTVVGDTWLTAYAERLGGRVEERDDAGLLPDLARLDGPGFAADRVDPGVRDFYEHTASWSMEVWSAWSPWAWPGGELVSRLFGRRVDQLSLPTRALEVARGIDSRVAPVVDAEGRQRAAGWLRTLRSTSGHVFSGCYSIRTLPGADRPSVHVAFPLEAGNVQVFLRPEVGHGGDLWLRSPAGPFGADGAYVVVGHRRGHHAARVPVHESFHVYPDRSAGGHGRRVLRTDHDLRLWGATAVRLHYKLQPRESG